jgi:hypothetical protein
MYPAGGIAVPNLFCVLVLQKVIEISCPTSFSNELLNKKSGTSEKNLVREGMSSSIKKFSNLYLWCTSFAI